MNSGSEKLVRTKPKYVVFRVRSNRVLLYLILIVNMDLIVTYYGHCSSVL